MGKIWIGTSGWTYDGWRGPFYPKDVPKKRWLNWYAEQFSTTEINGSFYRTPSLESLPVRDELRRKGAPCFVILTTIRKARRQRMRGGSRSC